MTMRYFNSDACRGELLAFHSNAKQMGVTDLLLPIILTGANQITADDQREEVRLIEALNHKNIEQAWIAGYDFPEWRRIVFDGSSDLSVVRAARCGAVGCGCRWRRGASGAGSW